MISKGELVELKVDSAGYRGVAVARLDDFVVFVKNAVPGDRVQARVIRKKKNYAEAVVEEILEPSAHRVKARCKYFGVCGGCSWQDVDYLQQLAFKRAQVEEIFSHLGGLVFPEIQPTLPSPHIYYYRNKMEFSFGTNRWLLAEEIVSGEEVRKGFALGLHLPKRWDKILDLEVCYLQSPHSADIVNEVRRIALEKGWEAYNSRTHRGYLRNLIIRTSATDELMVNLVTHLSDPQGMQMFAQELVRSFPQITTFVNTINDTRSPVPPEKAEEVVYHGQGTIEEHLCHLVFTIRPQTFFQPNTGQAERLCRLVRDYARLQPEDTVYDLYCGTGALALFLSDGVGRVVGIENQQSAFRDAKRNADANHVSNCIFHFGDVRQALSGPTVTRWEQPDVVIADPPRAGMHKDVCRSLLHLAPRQIVYVSCNPSTQARDLKILCHKYQIEALQPVDMFPHTYHIENVVGLRRSN